MLDLTVTLAHIFVVVGAIASGGIWAINISRDVKELKRDMSIVKRAVTGEPRSFEEPWS